MVESYAEKDWPNKLKHMSAYDQMKFYLLIDMYLR